MSEYIIITAAFNEEGNIKDLVSSVQSQTLTPKEWIVVDDNSNDRTCDMILKYEKLLPYLKLLRHKGDSGRNFGSKVMALREGLKNVKTNYDYIGFLDADITLDTDYYEKILGYFDNDNKIGIAGGDVWEKEQGTFKPRKVATEDTMPNAIQTFRRECYESIGGLLAMPYGGEDTTAEVKAKMNGWKVKTYSRPVAYHHRPPSSAEGLIKGRFIQGKMDYTLGNSVLWEILMCCRRVIVEPVIVGSIVRMFGYGYALTSIKNIYLDKEHIHYVKRVQRKRMLEFFFKYKAKNYKG